MSVARDGSPVELYALLPPLGEAAHVARAVPAGGSILELGCGAGRITRQLVSRGYVVVAVDESPEMLAHVRDAETVCARIQELDLERRFDATLLASNLVNAAAVDDRRAFLTAASRHSKLVVVQGLPLGWEPDARETSLGDVTTRLRVESIADGIVNGSVDYALGARSWDHPFALRVFANRRELDAALAEAGLRFDRWLGGEDRGWFLAVGSQRGARGE